MRPDDGHISFDPAGYLTSGIRLARILVRDEPQSLTNRYEIIHWLLRNFPTLVFCRANSLSFN